MLPVILASASPRRKQLLSLIIPEYEIIPSSVEDTLVLPADLSPEKEPEFLSMAKAMDIAASHEDHLVIGSDTVVLFPKEEGGFYALGKPHTEEEAFQMLKMLSGKRHYVTTGCSLVHGAHKTSFSVTSCVDFYDLSDEEIRTYIATKEPMDKAGGYGIQGIGGILVKGIEGDYANVVGLPLACLYRKLKEFLEEEGETVPGGFLC